MGTEIQQVRRTYEGGRIMSEVKVTKDLENKTLILEREFDAPKDKVWKAYADKEWFEAWWGPEGWETKVKEFSFAPGGRVHYDMKCVDKAQGEWFGQSSWGLMAIEAVDAPNSFTYVDYFSDETGVPNKEMPVQTVTVELVENGGRTNMIIRAISEKAEQIEELIKMGMVEGFSSQMNKLDAMLAE
jgi:uncharacterized protein YndB with AHSA1/START domain